MNHTSVIQARYDAAHTVHYHIKYNSRTDADVIERLASVPSKQDYIRRLIRRDIERGDKKMETKRYRVIEDPALFDLWYWGMDQTDIEETQRDGMPMEEIQRLAREWDKPINELLEQVEEI